MEYDNLSNINTQDEKFMKEAIRGIPLTLIFLCKCSTDTKKFNKGFT